MDRILAVGAIPSVSDAYDAGAVRTLVVLPTFNEAANIEEVLQRLLEACPKVSVLVVDDSSPDGTADLVEQIRDARPSDSQGTIRVLRRPQKSGLGSAYREGFRQGLVDGFAVMVEMDSDLSHDPKVLPELLAAVEAGADLALGSRYIHGGSIPDWSWHRRALSRWGNRYAAKVLALPLTDSTSGFRAYRADVLALIDLPSVHADGYAFQIEMAYRVLRSGGSISEVGISFTDRVRGESKMSSRIIVEALALVTWWGIRDRVLRVR